MPWELTATVTVTMPLDIHLDCTERCFDMPEWRELLKRDPQRHVFATPEWNKVWWEEFRSSGVRKDLFILTMRRDTEVVGIVPLYRKHEGDNKVFRFMGGIDLTDYLGPICSLEDRGEIAENLVRWLMDTDVEWSEFDAHNMPVPFGFAEFLVDYADRSGLEFSLDQEETSAVLLLPGDWDEYEAGLDSKNRHELRRKRRRLGRDHPDAEFRTAAPETLEADLKVFIDMHRGAEGMKGHFMKPEIATFFERVARAFMELDWLRLDLLEIGGKAIASTFSFELDGTFYLYNSAYEPDMARLSPGFVLVTELIKRSIEKGLTRFDFLRGPERYKYQLGAQAVPLNNVLIRSSNANAASTI
jgi:CelD/BcsL family acetyltransferase involved in cellulose biosynthesis